MEVVEKRPLLQKRGHHHLTPPLIAVPQQLKQVRVAHPIKALKVGVELGSGLYRCGFEDFNRYPHTPPREDSIVGVPPHPPPQPLVEAGGGGHQLSKRESRHASCTYIHTRVGGREAEGR